MIKSKDNFIKQFLTSNKFLVNNKVRISFLAFLFIVTFIVWRTNFSFFFMDEWDWLRDLAEGDFNIWKSHNEHFLPIMRIFYYFQINILKASPLMMHYIMLILHTLVSFAFGYLIWLILKENILSIAGTLAFMLHPFQYENVLWNFQSQIILNVGFFLISLIFLKIFLEKRNVKNYYLSLFFTFVQAYCFGNGLILPILTTIFFILFKKKNLSLKYSIPYLVIFVFNLVIYKLFGSEKITSHTGPFSIKNIPSIIDYFSKATFYNVSRSLTFIGNPCLRIAFIIFILFFSVYIFVLLHDLKTRKKVFPILVFSLFLYFTCFILISITRFKMGFEQSFSYRYAYYYLIPIILLCLIFIKYTYGKKQYKNIYPLLITSFTLTFSILATYRTLYYKNEVEARNRFNYQELKQYSIDKDYDPNLLLLHPYLTKDEILQTSIKLNLINNED